MLFFGVLGFILYNIGFHNYDIRKVTFKENSHIDYKVYLKPNDFFEEEYLPENMTYITSLIDHINLDFSYQIDLNDYMSGTYTYYIKGVVEASQTDSDSKYYTKEYILSDTTTREYKNRNSIEINENIDVNYQTYNNILNEFKNEYGVSMDGNLKVSLVIQNIVKDDQTKNTPLKETELELNIPLTSLSLEVPIETNEDNNEGVLFSDKIEKEGVIYIVARVLSIIAFVISVILLGYLISFIYRRFKQESFYQKKLKKILKVYDGIIVNLQKRPPMDKTNVLPVSSFEELIDAHSEVRNPINYIDEKDGALFLLVSDDFIYYYKLKREKNKKDKS